MALPHAGPGQPIDIRPHGAALAQQKTVALFKSDDLEVLRLVLQPGQSMPAHKVAGEVTIQCLEGRLDIALTEGAVALSAGELVFLHGGQVHAVTAVEPSSALLTLALPAK